MVVSCMKGLAGYTGSKHLCLPNVLYMTLTKKIVSQVRLACKATKIKTTPTTRPPSLTSHTLRRERKGVAATIKLSP